VARAAFAVDSSDHLALVNAFDMYMRVRDMVEEKKLTKADLSDWCNLHYLDIRGLEEARTARDKLGPFLKKSAKLKPTRQSAANTNIVRKALAIALSHKAAIVYGADEYRTVHDNVAARPEPLSCVVDLNSEWIVYNRLNKIGGNIYLETATSIEAEWLVVSANHHCKSSM
jgi:hypothetical protein